jgi:hypothetical protein
MAYEDITGIRPRTFLNSEDFNQLCIGIKSLIAEPSSQVYFDPAGKAIDKTMLRDRILRCDSIIETSYDREGKETVIRSFQCDSVSVLNNINMVVFYESWYFNKTNKMIEKEVLGYSVLEYVDKRKAYKELFLVFKDEKARNKVRKYCFY